MFRSKASGRDGAMRSPDGYYATGVRRGTRDKFFSYIHFSLLISGVAMKVKVPCYCVIREEKHPDMYSMVSQ